MRRFLKRIWCAFVGVHDWAYPRFFKGTLDRDCLCCGRREDLLVEKPHG